jgi:hypothetical protein
MSIDANPSIKEIATIFGDTPPYSMSKLYGLNFSSGNAVTSGTISLSGFRNKTVEFVFDETKIVASDGGYRYYFGDAVSISDDGLTLAISSNGYDSSKGAAYIFEKVNGVWTEVAKLTASDGVSWVDFGKSIDITGDGSTVVVGADSVANQQGAVYIFEKGGSGWSNMTETAKLTGSDIGTGDWVYGRLGISVCISNDGSTVVAGAFISDNYVGAAYIYDRGVSGWSSMTETVKIVPSDAPTDGVERDWFGWSVDISNDSLTLAVSSLYDDSQTGSAYIFEKVNSVWTETAKLTASDGEENHEFGRSVSLSGDGLTLVVGRARYGGKAYIFSKGDSGWSSMTETAILGQSDDPAANMSFGISAFISDDGSKVLVGASSGGSAYRFEKGGSGWSSMTQTGKFIPFDGAETESFWSFGRYGYDVCMTDDFSTVAVGADFNRITIDGVSTDFQGSVYIYEKNYFVS